MKRIIILLLVILVLVVGCTSNNTSSSNENISNDADSPIDNKGGPKSNQKYSFGPMADPSKIDDETKKQLQELLDRLGNPVEGMISFNIIDASFEEDGSMVIDLFIRNGYEYSITNINCNMQIIEDGASVASANFKFKKEEFGVLPAKTSRPWSILFYPEDILMKKTDVNKWAIEAIDIYLEHVES